jgi:hypothetical protein
MDDNGVDSLPVALVASALLLALVLGFAAMGLKNAQPMVSTASVDDQVSKMANGCREMIASAPRDLHDPASPPGATRQFELTLPQDTEYVGLGYDPEAEVSDEGTIYYKVHGSKKAIVVDKNVKFRQCGKSGIDVFPTDGHMVIYGGGRRDIILEYARDSAFDERYILCTG